MNSLINNNVNIGGAQNISGGKTFTGDLIKKSLIIDIDNPDGTKANQMLFTDKNGVTYNFFQSAQFTTGQTQFGLACKAASGNSFAELGLIQKADGTSWAYTPNAQELGANSGNQVVSVNNLRDRTTFASGDDCIALSVTLDSIFSAPADGLLVATAVVAGNLSQISLYASGKLVAKASCNGSTALNDIPFFYPVRKGEALAFTSSTSGGSVSIGNASIWQFPYQGV